MPRIKKTKNELKAQRDALTRFHRFLPTLELKKQQLQREVRHVEILSRERRLAEDELWSGLRPWAKLLVTYEGLVQHASVEQVRVGITNIAGVTVPLFEGIDFATAEIDYFATPPWLDDAVAVLRSAAALRAERLILERQRDLLSEELRITSQRVNLFEKVMIPRTEENIRIIRIALGDAQTAAVARAKLAKGKGQQLLSGAGS